MKHLIIAAVITVSLSPSFAADRVMTISEQEAQAWSNVSGVMERCVGSIMISRNFQVCESLSQFLQQFAAGVAKAKVIELEKPAETGDQK